MTYGPDPFDPPPLQDAPQQDRPPNEPVPSAGRGLRLPLSQPRAVYVLLAIIGVMFVVETLLGGSTNLRTLAGLGAQVNALVAQGEYWRLLSAMFLHIGLWHVAFNAWALYSLGRDLEALYGTWRFLAIYFVSGLAGGVTYYVLGGLDSALTISAGASGAVFGLIGAETALFLTNRELFGRFGRQRLTNLAILIGINLVFGLTVSGINNLVHLGGLAAGFLIGLGLTPRYRAEWEPQPYGASPRLVNKASVTQQALTIVAALVVLVGGLWLGNQRWRTEIGPLAGTIGVQPVPAPEAGPKSIIDTSIPMPPPLL